ncbi:MAG: 50S ribosomal protein L21 [Oscillospiraceae bacterium]|nr:50S ribosomal protein L21 [Oscillospiraceae bacterium]
MYAIITTGGKQYRVQEGDVIYVEKLDAAADSPISFDALMLGGDESTTIGTPIVPGARVEGKIISQVLSKKILVYKYKAKKNSRRRQGHRQPYTKVEITSIRA